MRWRWRPPPLPLSFSLFFSAVLLLLFFFFAASDRPREGLDPPGSHGSAERSGGRRSGKGSSGGPSFRRHERGHRRRRRRQRRGNLFSFALFRSLLLLLFPLPNHFRQEGRGVHVEERVADMAVLRGPEDLPALPSSSSVRARRRRRRRLGRRGRWRRDHLRGAEGVGETQRDPAVPCHDDAPGRPQGRRRGGDAVRVSKIDDARVLFLFSLFGLAF